MCVMSNQADGALKRLQSLTRRLPSGERTVRTRKVPQDIATAEFQWLHLEPDDEQAYQEAEAALLNDLRFEYLDQRAAADALWRFTCQCVADRAADHVTPFIRQRAREILELVCYLPVEHLQAEAETDIAGLRLLPTTSNEIPRNGRGFELDPPVRSVAAVRVSGTSLERMADRARVAAERGLRVLRIALRADRGVHDDQLRFGLGEAYAFDDRLSGWARRPGAPIPLALAASSAELVRSQPVAALSAVPRNRLERKAELAVRWMERSMLATEPLVRLLYLFFALESLLGDRQEGEKAGLIALRRAMLSHVMGQGFTHPSQTYHLYDKVRSAAVHGSEPPEVSEADVRLFAWDVREALGEYLRYGQQHGFTRQSHLLAALDNDPDRPRLIEWIRDNGGDMWDKVPRQDRPGDGRRGRREQHMRTGFCRMRAQIGYPAYVRAGHGMVGVSHGKEKVGDGPV